MRYILIICALIMVTLDSCKKDSTSNTCDKGNLEVLNRTGAPIYVSVVNQATGITTGGSNTWTSISKGTIRVAAKPMTGDPNVDWTYFSVTINGCETTSLTISDF